MLKRTFRYCGNHLKDEAYMNLMSSKGYAALSLVEGFWTFEKSKQNEYCYRILYLRGLSKKKIEKLKQDYQNNGIEFVSSYSFWAIFRSKKFFKIYNQEEELEICKKIFKIMPYGVIIGVLLFIILVFLSFKLSYLFLILATLVLIYDIISLYVSISYYLLIRRLSSKR